MGRGRRALKKAAARTRLALFYKTLRAEKAGATRSASSHMHTPPRLHGNGRATCFRVMCREEREARLCSDA